jgi:muramidase (phage lysozyme)
MAVSGVRAQRFLQPASGGASAVFARQRGMVAPAPSPARLSAAEEKESRSGKASGRDYGNFFSKKRNVSAIQGAVNALKGLLVGTFIAAKSLGATLKGVVKQIKGMSGGGGGGLFGTLGMIGLVGALIAGVAAIFGPQIKKAFDWLKGGAEGIFQDVKGRLDAADKNLEKLYNTIKDFVNVTVTNIIAEVNSAIGSINNVVKAIKPIAEFMANAWMPGPLSVLNTLGKALSDLPTLPDPLIPQDKLPKLPEYRDVLGDNGINFLKGYDSLGDLGGAMVSGAGNMLGGGIDSMTGFVGDILNNMLASLGLTDAGNVASEYLGMGSLFGESRELGSGEGVSSLIPGGFEGIIPGIQSTLGLGGSNAPINASPGGLTAEQKAFLETVSFAEGTEQRGYNTWFGNQLFPKEQPDLSKYTINEIVNLQKRFNREGLGKFAGGTSAAVGKYQMTYPETYAKKAGLDPAVDKFTPENQDKMAMYGYIMGQGGVTEAEINAPEMSDATIDKLAPVFASFPNLVGPGKNGKAAGDGQSYYPNQGAKRKAEIKKRHEQNRSRIQAPPPASAAPAPQGSTKTTAPAKPVNKASTIVLPAGPQVAQAPRRPRPDTSVPNISGEGGNPTIAFYSPSFPDIFDLNPIGALGC